MNKEKGRVPKLRFPGFTEDWEQRKLGDLAEIVRGASPRPISDPKWFDNNSKVGWLRIADVTAQDGRIRYLEQKISELGQEKTRVIKTPHLLLSIAATVGKPVINYVPTGVHDGFLIFLNPKFNILFTFWWLEMFREKWNKYGQPGSQVNLNSDLVKNQVINIPNEKEQEEISSFLEALDKIITLHQRKLEHLNLKKKALLQKLFPKNGERYPEIRFPGFTDAWEQRKLNEFLSVSNFKNTDNKYNKNNVLSVSGDYGIVNQIEFQGRSFAGVSVSNYGVVETGDIVYTKSPLKLNPYGIIKANRINAGIVSTLYAIYKTKKNCDSKFIEHYFNLDSRLNKYLKPLVNKGAKNDMKVSSENALIGEVCFPHVTEQKLIADFLDRLDLFITLHQRKLEHLQLQKKALLQQMFV